MEKFENEVNSFLGEPVQASLDTEPRLAKNSPPPSNQKNNNNKTDNKPTSEWKKVVAQLQLKIGKKGISKEQLKHAKFAISVMLSTPEGLTLGRELVALFRTPGTRISNSRLRIVFLEKKIKSFKARDGETIVIEKDTGGIFHPAQLQASEYTAYIKYHPRKKSNSTSFDLDSHWPERGLDCSIRFSFTNPISLMAETVFHELLHVWFLNTQNNTRYHTGHSIVSRCEIEPLFLKRLKTFFKQLDELEKRLLN